MSETDVGEVGLPHARPREITPSQTIGPFFAFALTPAAYDASELVGNDLRTDDAEGTAIVIEGRLLDGDGALVPDAMIEIWQADGTGRYATGSTGLANSRFKGFGRSETAGGTWSFLTIKPGPVPGPGGRAQAPHVNIGIFARGILKRLFTRLYFDDDASNVSDPILALVPADRRTTLIARRDGSRGGLPRYVLDIRLQGADETVFFEA
jgi:protocatechuate 3,4-dioxygenase, alpha subunit